MGGIIRCVKNDYNLDQVENEINRTDSEVDFDNMMANIKQKNNIYIDNDIQKGEDHYLNNSLLVKEKPKKTQSIDISAFYSTKIKI